MTAEIKDLLTVAEAAELLRVKSRTLAQWRYRQVGPEFIRVGRGVRYPRSGIDRWLDEGGDTSVQH